MVWMVEFALPIKCPNWLLAVVAAHGSTDIVLGPRLICYVFVLLPLPDWMVTCGFAIASLKHFAHDVGMNFAVVLHLVLVVLYARARTQLATSVLLGFMVLVHLPRHFARVLTEDYAFEAMAFCALFTATLDYMKLWKESFLLSHVAQRLVISHVICHLD